MDRQRSAPTVGRPDVLFRRGPRLLCFSLCLALGAISLPACKQQQEVERAKASANQSYEDLKALVGRLQTATADLRARFNALPEDLPDLEPIRSRLLAVEEVLGVEGGRVQWLSGELNAAFRAGKKEPIQKLSQEIRVSVEGDKGVGNTILALTHQLLPFERLAAQREASATQVAPSASASSETKPPRTRRDQRPDRPR